MYVLELICQFSVIIRGGFDQKDSVTDFREHVASSPLFILRSNKQKTNAWIVPQLATLHGMIPSVAHYRTILALVIGRANKFDTLWEDRIFNLYWMRRHCEHNLSGLHREEVIQGTGGVRLRREGCGLEHPRPSLPPASPESHSLLVLTRGSCYAHCRFHSGATPGERRRWILDPSSCRRSCRWARNRIPCLCQSRGCSTWPCTGGLLASCCGTNRCRWSRLSLGSCSS